MRVVVLVLILLVVVLSIALFWKMSEVSRFDTMLVPWKKRNPCLTGPGQQGPDKPVVCIDLTTFDQPGYQPDPNPIRVRGGKRVEFFFKQKGAQLEVQFTPDTPVQNNGQKDENYWADAKTVQQVTQKKYTIIDRKTGRHADPEIVIEP